MVRAAFPQSCALEYVLHPQLEMPEKAVCQLLSLRPLRAGTSTRGAACRSYGQQAVPSAAARASLPLALSAFAIYRLREGHPATPGTQKAAAPRAEKAEQQKYMSAKCQRCRKREEMQTPVSKARNGFEGLAYVWRFSRRIRFDVSIKRHTYKNMLHENLESLFMTEKKYRTAEEAYISVRFRDTTRN